MLGDRVYILSTAAFTEEPLKGDFFSRFELDVIPFVKTQNRLTSEIVKIIRRFASEEQTVIFTSKQAVEAVISVLEHVPAWEIYCMNGATREAVMDFWKEQNIRGMAENGAALAGKIRETYLKKDRPLLFICGQQRLDTIPEQLQQHQISFHEIIVYETVATPRPIDKLYDGILFFSPSGVRSFFSQNNAGDAVLFCIGNTTAEALRSYVKEDYRIITADRPDKKELVERAIYYFKEKSDEYKIKK